MSVEDTVLIYSGGMDSTTLLYKNQARIALAVSFNYGSKHNARELEMAKFHCKKLDIPHRIVDLEFIKRYFVSSLLNDGEPIPEGHYQADNMKSTVVPFRNGIMLSIAVGLAESYGLTRVQIGAHTGDHAIYPDCRNTFIRTFSEAAAYGTYNNVTIDCDFLTADKTEIARVGTKLGIDFSKTWTCYKGGEKHCGKCGSCNERREAFKLAGIKDPTDYEER